MTDDDLLRASTELRPRGLGALDRVVFERDDWHLMTESEATVTRWLGKLGPMTVEKK